MGNSGAVGENLLHVLLIVTFSNYVCFITYTNLRVWRPLIVISPQQYFVNLRKQQQTQLILCINTSILRAQRSTLQRPHHLMHFSSFLFGWKLELWALLSCSVGFCCSYNLLCCNSPDSKSVFSGPAYGTSVACLLCFFPVTNTLRGERVHSSWIFYFLLTESLTWWLPCKYWNTHWENWFEGSPHALHPTAHSVDKHPVCSLFPPNPLGALQLHTFSSISWTVLCSRLFQNLPKILVVQRSPVVC